MTYIAVGFGCEAADVIRAVLHAAMCMWHEPAHACVYLGAVCPPCSAEQTQTQTFAPLTLWPTPPVHTHSIGPCLGCKTHTLTSTSLPRTAAARHTLMSVTNTSCLLLHLFPLAAGRHLLCDPGTHHGGPEGCSACHPCPCCRCGCCCCC